MNRLTKLRNDRGQTLFLAPIAFLIVVLLGGVVLEAGNLHLRQRQLDNLADSIASDAAAVGFNIDEFRMSGSITIDPAAANSVVQPAIDISNLPTASGGGVTVNPGVEPELEVTLTYVHQFVFGQQVFGATSTLQATGSATLVPSG